MKSEKFQGQIESDHDLFFREGVFTQQEGRGQFIWVVPAEFKAEAMKVFREKDAIPAG